MDVQIKPHNLSEISSTKFNSQLISSVQLTKISFPGFRETFLQNFNEIYNSNGCFLCARGKMVFRIVILLLASFIAFLTRSIKSYQVFQACTSHCSTPWRGDVQNFRFGGSFVKEMTTHFQFLKCFT